jgi:hypothetical protein
MRYRWTCPHCGHPNTSFLPLPNDGEWYERATRSFARCSPKEGCGRMVAVDLLFEPRVLATLKLKGE